VAAQGHYLLILKANQCATRRSCAV
jgi:hypothetical protein